MEVCKAPYQPSRVLEKVKYFRESTVYRPMALVHELAAECGKGVLGTKIGVKFVECQNMTGGAIPAMKNADLESSLYQRVSRKCKKM